MTYPGQCLAISAKLWPPTAHCMIFAPALPEIRIHSRFIQDASILNSNDWANIQPFHLDLGSPEVDSGIPYCSN